MTSEKKIPEGRFGRLRRLAGLGARTGASLLFSRDGGVAAAEKAAEVLGTLRGLAAKLGQMASYVDGMVPESHRDAYETALRGLRAAAPTSSPEQIRHLVEEELGAPISELFAEWDDVPLASASIGQVHRARMLDGRAVAVKVQHPGIDVAIESDLENAGMIQGLVATLGPRQLNSREVFDEIKQRFREELDYKLEAERQNFFRKLHDGDPNIEIPAIVPERSSGRVMTSDLKQGTSLEQAATEPEALRRTYAETLWRFVFKGNLIGGMFNADPHPGNYLFQPDGRIVFLDFGCVQPITGHHLTAARGVHRAAVRRDLPAFRRNIRDILGTQGGAYEEVMLTYLRTTFEPLFGSPFHITRSYVKSLADGILEIKQLVLKSDSGFVPLREELIFMNRLQFGFYSVLARLDLPVDYATVEQNFFSAAGLTL